MKNNLDLFRRMQVSKAELQNLIGNDLHNARCTKPQLVTRDDVVAAIQAALNGTKTVGALVEWVNVIWFTDLFEFADDDAESIISVLEVLETLDEEGVSISNSELDQMIEALRGNSEYTP